MDHILERVLFEIGYKLYNLIFLNLVQVIGHFVFLFVLVLVFYFALLLCYCLTKFLRLGASFSLLISFSAFRLVTIFFFLRLGVNYC
jgi:hypothetical protein